MSGSYNNNNGGGYNNGNQDNTLWLGSGWASQDGRFINCVLRVEDLQKLPVDDRGLVKITVGVKNPNSNSQSTATHYVKENNYVSNSGGGNQPYDNGQQNNQHGSQGYNQGYNQNQQQSYNNGGQNSHGSNNNYGNHNPNYGGASANNGQQNLPQDDGSWGPVGNGR